MNRDLLHKFYKEYPIKTANVGKKTWEYIACGIGKETLLLLPGGGQTAQGNFRLIQAFEKKYRIIVPTIYNVDTIEEFCFAINTILKKEKVKRIILYGLSIGGLMAQSYIKRNKEKVTTLIIFHACTPKSQLYRRKIVPLLKLSFLLPFVPVGIFSSFLKHFAGKLQGAPKQKIDTSTKNETQIISLTKLFTNEFFEKYLTKRLLTTWSNLHKDFIKESFSSQDFFDWKGKVLILRSDDDPLMQDEGDFKKVYPQASTYTFHHTGHLTYYYQFPQMVKVMQNFFCLHI